MPTRSPLLETKFELHVIPNASCIFKHNKIFIISTTRYIYHTAPGSHHGCGDSRSDCQCFLVVYVARHASGTQTVCVSLACLASDSSSWRFASVIKVQRWILQFSVPTKKVYLVTVMLLLHRGPITPGGWCRGPEHGRMYWTWGTVDTRPKGGRDREIIHVWGKLVQLLQ